jgi:hypothetical protein
MMAVPGKAEWAIGRTTSGAFPPFNGLEIDFAGNSGTASTLSEVVKLTNFGMLTQTSRFDGSFQMNLISNYEKTISGKFEAEIQEDCSLRIKFVIGTTTTESIGLPVYFIELPVLNIATRFKGAHDIAGVAQALYDAQIPFEWSLSSKFEEADSFDKFLGLRRMCCYEFVHYAAYLAGWQRLTKRNVVEGGPKIDGGPWVSGAGGTVFVNKGSTSWLPIQSLAPDAAIPKNKLLLGVARLGKYFNNSSGYYHVGISLGGRRVISLSGGSNLHIEDVESLFSSYAYAEVRIGNYNWITAQADGGASLMEPPMPPLKFVRPPGMPPERPR